MEIFDIYSGDYWSSIWRIMISVIDISDLRSGDSWSPKFCKKDPPSHTCPPSCPPPYTDKKKKTANEEEKKDVTPAARPKFLSHEEKTWKSCVYLCPLIWQNFISNGPEKEQKTNWNTKKSVKKKNYSMWTA